MTIPRVWPAPFNLSTNWVGVNLRWKEEENMESKTQLAHYSTPLFFPSLRGPPKVWHHSWIQLSLKYLQLKYILIYIYCTSDVHTEEILFTSYSSCRLGRQNGQFSKGTYMYVLTSHCNNAPKSSIPFLYRLLYFLSSPLQIFLLPYDVTAWLYNHAKVKHQKVKGDSSIATHSYLWMWYHMRPPDQDPPPTLAIRDSLLFHWHTTAVVYLLSWYLSSAIVEGLGIRSRETTGQLVVCPGSY